jgi:hypothetical protein
MQRIDITNQKRPAKNPQTSYLLLVLNVTRRRKKVFETEYCKVEYLKKQNAVYCRWKKRCNSQNYRAPFEFGLKLINEHHASMWITDTTNGFENEPDDTRWLFDAFIPKVIASSCESIAFIIQEDSPLEEEIEQQEAGLSQYFKVQKVNSLEEVH